MAAAPTVRVEIGFSDDITSDADAIAWTDVTGYVRAENGVKFSRGRAEAGAAPSAGMLNFSLVNNDGRFTPGPAGPMGKIRTGVPVRVTAVAPTMSPSPFTADWDDAFVPTGGAIVDLWWGWVTDWSWDASGEYRATVDAADILAPAARAVAGPWLQMRHRNLPAGQAAPIAYWPLADPAAATQAASRVATSKALQRVVRGAGGQMTFGVASDLAPDPEIPVAAFLPGTPGSDRNSTFLRGWCRPTSNGLAVSAWVMPTAAVGTSMNWVDIRNGDVGTLAVGVDGYRHAVAYAGGEVTTYGPEGAVPLGRWTHIYAQLSQSTNTVGLWVNGQSVLPNETLPTGYGDPGMTAGNDVERVDVGGSWEGQLAHVAVWDQTTTPAALPGHLASRGTGQPRAGQRFAELATVTSSAATWSTWLAASGADATVTAQTTAGIDLLTLVQQLADTEAGRVIATRRGRLALQSSRASITATPAVTLDARTGVMALDGAFAIDDTRAIDEVTVTNQPSGVQIVRRRGGAGVESVTRDVWAADPLQAEAIADAIVAADTDDPSAPTLKVSVDRLAFDGDPWDLLTLELGDLVQVTNLPAAAPYSTMNFVVESIDHDITTSGWTVSIGTSPGSGARGWVLGDADLSVLGDSTIIRL